MSPDTVLCSWENTILSHSFSLCRARLFNRELITLGLELGLSTQGKTRPMFKAGLVSQ